MTNPHQITLPQGPFADVADMEAQIVAEVERAHGARNCGNCKNLIKESSYDYGEWLMCEVNHLYFSEPECEKQYFPILKCNDWAAPSEA